MSDPNPTPNGTPAGCMLRAICHEAMKSGESLAAGATKPWRFWIRCWEAMPPQLWLLTTPPG